MPLLAAAALAFAAAACNGGDDGTAAGVALAQGGTGGVYLALGDSVAAGGGATDAGTGGYAALVAEALRGRFGEGLELQVLAVAGHTTQDLIEEQLPMALERVRGGDVRLVTLTIGGNDMNQYGAEPACLPDPSVPACPLEDGLLDVEQRLRVILQELRAAGPEAAIVIQVYPNLFAGTGHEFERPADIAFGLLNGVIKGVAREQGVLVADAGPAFALDGPMMTHLLDPTPDAHPNDAGHAAIAEAFLEALGLSPVEE